MKKMNNTKILVVAMAIATFGTAQAELSTLQKQVIADHETMQTLNAAEKRDFRQQIWHNEDKATQRAYNKAYKAMVNSGLITFENKSQGTPNTVVSDRTRALKINKTGRRGGGGDMITYHSGALSGSPTGVGNRMVGNRFNTGGSNPVASSGSITMFTVDMAAVSGNAFLSVFDAPNFTAGTANKIDSQSLPMTTGFNTVTVNTVVNYTGTDFLAGIWATNSGSDQINLATGTVAGQGFHGVEVTSGGSSLVAYPNTNAAFGVSGTVTTPVELMNFSVE